MNNRRVQLPLAKLSPVLLECLEQGQEVVLPITGTSMTPFLRHGRDQVVLKRTDPTAMQPGDVPLYRRPDGSYVLHRIIQRDDGMTRIRLGERSVLPTAGQGVQYTMLGDAQLQEESGVIPEQIVAVAVAFLRGDKRQACTHPAYRRRVVVWQRLLPLRHRLMTVYRLLQRR